MAQTTLIRVLSKVKQKQLTAAQQRFAVEVFEMVLNGREITARSNGGQIRVEWIEKKAARSV